MDVSAPTIDLTLDLAAALRRRKPEKRTQRLDTRDDVELVSAADLLGTGPIPLVADTNVYINDAAGRLSPAVEVLLDRTILFHCSVCVGEIAVGIANGDPAHRRWRSTRDVYQDVLGAIPDSRLLTPDPQTWMEAGLIAGTLSRLQDFQPHQRKEMFNDALILLTSAKVGVAVLTSDRDHFDWLQQLCPEARFVFYR